MQPINLRLGHVDSEYAAPPCSDTLLPVKLQYEIVPPLIFLEKNIAPPYLQ